MGSYKLHTFLLLLITLLIELCPSRAGRTIRNFRKVKAKDNDPASFPYLYATRTDLNASFPVVEHIAPARKRDLEDDRPSFLYAKRQGFRIVVFVSGT